MKEFEWVVDDQVVLLISDNCNCGAHAFIVLKDGVYKLRIFPYCVDSDYYTIHSDFCFPTIKKAKQAAEGVFS
jgi:hypothetical protein